MINLLIAIFIVAVLYFLSKYFKTHGLSGGVFCSFKKKKCFFTSFENRFFKILKDIADRNNLIVFSMVRMIDVFDLSGISRRDWSSCKNKVIQKHIDFVICDNKDFKILLCIELDDPTHNRGDRIKRDDFVDEAFKSAELPLLRFKTQNNYDVKGIEDKILNYWDL